MTNSYDVLIQRIVDLCGGVFSMSSLVGKVLRRAAIMISVHVGLRSRFQD
jgi:hypothetical protein